MIVVRCPGGCHRDVTVSEPDLIIGAHWASMVGVPCERSGRELTLLSKIPSWHPRHVCGIFCDGQDGQNSYCAREKRRGPPSAIDQLAELSRLEGRMRSDRKSL